MLQISHADDAKRSGFMKDVQRASRPAPSHAHIKANEGPFFGRILQLYVELHVANISAGGGGGACKQSCLFMFKKRIIKLIERSKAAGSGACSAAMPPRSRAPFHLLRAPKLVFDCVLLTQVATSRLLSSLCSSSSTTFMCSFVGDTASFLPKLFLKQQ